MRIYINKNPSEKYSTHMFVGKLVASFDKLGIKWTNDRKAKWDACLALIENNDPYVYSKGPVIQRLDGIYFNTDDESMKANYGIKKTYQNAAGVVFQSDLAKKIVTKNFGTTKAKTTVIINGTNIENDEKANSALQSDYPHIYSAVKPFKRKLICSGKWRTIKRLESIIDGSLQYFNTDPECCLIIVGSSNKDEVERYASISKNIIFTDRIPNEAVRCLQLISDVCLNLSFTDSCPNAIIEALAHGTPCVVTKNQGVAEIMGDKDGVVLDVDDWDFGPISYNKGIIQIDPNLVAGAIGKCISIGKQPIREDLSMDKVAMKYYEFIKKCVGK